MEHKNNKKPERVKKLSDFILTFAFLYSSLICFIEAKEQWEENTRYAVIIMICGFFSFIAVFRWQIANIYYFLRKFKNNAK